MDDLEKLKKSVSLIIESLDSIVENTYEPNSSLDDAKNKIHQAWSVLNN